MGHIIILPAWARMRAVFLRSFLQICRTFVKKDLQIIPFLKPDPQETCISVTGQTLCKGHSIQIQKVQINAFKMGGLWNGSPLHWDWFKRTPDPCQVGSRRAQMGQILHFLFFWPTKENQTELKQTNFVWPVWADKLCLAKRLMRLVSPISNLVTGTPRCTFD